MANIKVSRYDEPTDAERLATDAHFPADSWDSYIEDEEGSWILFIAKDGTPYFWANRTESGAVIGEAATR